MAKKWREFEKLVARIERLLGPEDAMVRSPERIRDKLTGSLREVDASIRYQVGSVPILITVECRDRNDVEDVTWIEQLHAKRQSIGAALTIAVSSSDFTQPAVKKAELYGIEIRRIDEVTDEDILTWANEVEITVVQSSYKLISLHIELYTGRSAPQLQLDPSAKELFRQQGFAAEIFTKSKDGTKWSIAKLLRHSKRTTSNGHPLKVGERNRIMLSPGGAVLLGPDLGFLRLFEGVPFDGTVVRKRCRREFPRGQLHVATTAGAFDLRRLEFDVELSQKSKRIPFARVVQYSDARDAIARIAEAEIDFGTETGPSLIISQHQISDATISTSMVPEEETREGS